MIDILLKILIEKYDGELADKLLNYMNEIKYKQEIDIDLAIYFENKENLQMAEKFYKKPGLADRLTAKDNNFVRPKEVDLLPLIETNSVDYIFLYKSVAVQHNLKFLELPPEINLREPKLTGLYNSASVSINGKEPGMKVIMKGEPMIYGITILKNAPNKKVALAFLEFLLSKEKGMKIMEKNGQPSVIPQKNPQFEKLPESLKPFATR